MQNITSPELNTYIEEQVILPSIQQEVELLIKSKKVWFKISIVTETLSQICAAVATILSFSSGIFQYQILSFLAGSINILSLMLLLFSKYSTDKSKQCLAELEKIPTFNLIRQRL
jgi:hypothetical protein